MPKKYCPIPLLFLFLVTWSAVAGQSTTDILNYTYRIELNDANDTLTGAATIRVRFLQPATDLLLDLTPQNKTGKGMKVDNVSGPGVRGFQVEPGKIRIQMATGKAPAAGDTVSFEVRYHGVPSDGMVISRNKFGRRTFFADNWPNRAHHWIPCKDDPADKAAVEFIVTAPAHYQVVSNGVQVEATNLPGEKKRTHYREDIPLPTKVMVIGVAEFAVGAAGEWGCVPVSSWVFPENSKEGFYDYAQATDILAWHSNYIGPYPYKKLANVQSKTMFGGMENAGAIFYEEGSVSGKREREELLSHEIVHQWFGNMATEKSFAHLWLSEGFATYLTHLYIEDKYGSERRAENMREDRDRVIGFVKSARRPVVDSSSDYMQLLNANSYQKGSWVLHMLRRQLGDSLFRTCIRRYYSEYAGRNADTRDLQKVVETVSGKKMDVFFTQWLYRSENPSLAISWKYDAAKKTVEGTVRQLQTTEFEFPLQVALVTASGAGTRQKLMITKRETSFQFIMPEKPVQFIADPNTDLLFDAKITELK